MSLAPLTAASLCTRLREALGADAHLELPAGGQPALALRIDGRWRVLLRTYLTGPLGLHLEGGPGFVLDEEAEVEAAIRALRAALVALPPDRRRAYTPLDVVVALLPHAAALGGPAEVDFPAPAVPQEASIRFGAARVALFPEPDGTRVVLAHLPDRTRHVRTDAELAEIPELLREALPRQLEAQRAAERRPPRPPPPPLEAVREALRQGRVLRLGCSRVHATFRQVGDGVRMTYFEEGWEDEDACDEATLERWVRDHAEQVLAALPAAGARPS